MFIHGPEYLIYLVIQGFDGIGCEVKIWDMRNAAASMAELRGHSQDVTCCSFVRSGDQVRFSSQPQYRTDKNML